MRGDTMCFWFDLIDWMKFFIMTQLHLTYQNLIAKIWSTVAWENRRRFAVPPPFRGAPSGGKWPRNDICFLRLDLPILLALFKSKVLGIYVLCFYSAIIIILNEMVFIFFFSFQVFDQYLNFISLEDEMFTVRNQDRDSISYYGKSGKWQQSAIWWPFYSTVNTRL